MGRMHGEHKNAYAGRQLWNAQKREVEELPYVPGETIWVEPACTCDWYPFAHVHTGFTKKVIMRRFREALPHPSREEMERLYQERDF